MAALTGTPGAPPAGMAVSRAVCGLLPLPVPLGGRPERPRVLQKAAGPAYGASPPVDGWLARGRVPRAAGAVRSALRVLWPAAAPRSSSTTHALSRGKAPPTASTALPRRPPEPRRTPLPPHGPCVGQRPAGIAATPRHPLPSPPPGARAARAQTGGNAANADTGMSLDGLELEPIQSSLPDSVANFDIAALEPLLPLLDPKIIDPKLLSELAALVPVVGGAGPRRRPVAPAQRARPRREAACTPAKGLPRPARGTGHMCARAAARPTPPPPPGAPLLPRSWT